MLTVRSLIDRGLVKRKPKSRFLTDAGSRQTATWVLTAAGLRTILKSPRLIPNKPAP